MQTERCDILICGGGLAGLSLLYRAMKSGVWREENIIVVDQSEKKENDRTWSFWKSTQTDFDHLIYRQWKDLLFFCHDGERLALSSGNYTYNSIRSIDFYTHVITWLQQFPNISFVKATVEHIAAQGATSCILHTKTHVYTSAFLFNSLYEKPVLKKDDQYFLQHFKGIKIRVQPGMLQVKDAHLMDFRTGQQHGTTFFYTLPISADELFVEYTLFSKTLLPEKEYDTQIDEYLTNVLKITDYEILEEEFGVIPMTDYRFTRFNNHIVNIGTIGGDTRASTGYTFTNTQKTITKILAAYQSQGNPFFANETIGLKQHLYDVTLLNVLAKENYEGYQLFGDLFKNTRASVIFAFLDAETSVIQDLQIMKSLRILPFLREFTRAVYRTFMK